MRSIYLTLVLVACTRPLEMPTPQLADPYVARPDVDEAILSAIQRDKVPGASVCTFDSTGPTWCTGYGWAHILEGRPARVDTPFLVASVSKAVTAVAVLQGVEEGLVDLDAPVNDVLPFRVDHPASSTPITLRHLMTHQSGIVDDWDVLEPLYVEGQDSPIALGDFLADYLAPGGSLNSEYIWSEWSPGAGYEYSNVGSALAAHLIEAAGGGDFDAWSRERIFEPVGMARTGWFFVDHEPSELAMPYTVSGSRYTPVGHMGVPDYPDGQLRASAEDLARFGAMVIRRGVTEDGTVILQESTVDEMLRVQVEAEEQGLFWYHFMLNEDRVYGHNGGETGVSAELLIRDGRGVVVLMNGEGGAKTLARIQSAALDGPE